MENFSKELKSYSIEVWNEILENRFIQELSNNTLPSKKFTFYLLQDKIFLNEFCIFLEKSSKLTNDEDTKKWMNNVVNVIVNDELRMQKELLRIAGYMNNNQTISISPTDVTQDYIDSMKKLLKNDDNKLHRIIAFMAPCPWTYYEIAEKIKKEAVIKSAAITKWVDFYSSFESKQQVDFILHLLNDFSKDLSNDERSEMKIYFNKACKHELDFWHAAYNYKQIL